MLNTTPQTAPKGVLPDIPNPTPEQSFYLFSLFMQESNLNHTETMKNTAKKVYTAVLEIAANTLETKEALAIVERLAQYHIGYQKTNYEWLETTKAHCFCVEFSGRLPIVAIHTDLATAIVLVNQRIMSAFKKPEYDLSRPVLTVLEQEFTGFTDHRTEYASAS